MGTYNPIELFTQAFWPKGAIHTKEETTRLRVVLYFNFFGVLVMLYSWIKWSNLGHYNIVYTSQLGLLMTIVSSFAVKFKMSPTTCANLFLVGAWPHGANMGFSLGGLESNHIFWMPALIIMAYLLTDRFSGFIWVILAILTVLAFIYGERTGYEFPNFEFETEQARKVDVYSGFILPMLIIWLAQNYSLKIRRQLLDESIESEKNSSSLAEKFQSNFERLDEILDEARSTCDTLSVSTDTLKKDIVMMEDNSRTIELGADSQVHAADDISSRVESTNETLKRTSSMVIDMENITNETETNVTNTANSIARASESINKIKDRFEQIENVIQVISEIVSQTNLLALNATIEAARAGDRGRGFAVVADEIRSLSIRCDQSANEIAEVIKLGSVEVDEGVELVDKSVRVLHDTANSVEDVTHHIHGVAKVIQELNDNMSGVAVATQQVGSTSTKNADSVKYLLESTSELNTITDELCEVSEKLQSVVNK